MALGTAGNGVAGELLTHTNYQQSDKKEILPMHEPIRRQAKLDQ